MAKESKSKKKIIVTPKAQPAVASSRLKSDNAEMLFGKENYLWIAGGFALILIGMFLMMGGGMPDYNTWDESIIYSTRRTLIAPLFILAGLIVEFFAIFRK